MKRVEALAIVCCLLLGMSACSMEGKIPSLREVANNGAEWGMEQLRQIPGCTLADLETAWGQAAGERYGEYAYFWLLDDGTTVNVYYYKNAEIESITIDDKITDSEETENASAVSSSDTIFWEYTPLLSSRLPALAFSFDIPCHEITGKCDSGSLIDYDNFDIEKGCYPQGKSLTVPNGSSLYWAPHDEMADYMVAASAELTFSVKNESGAILYHGTLKISEEEIQQGMVSSYSASLVPGSGLTLTQDETQFGGVLSEIASDSGD